MVTITTEISELAQKTRKEVLRYAGYSPIAKLYPLIDDSNQSYAVVMMEDSPEIKPAWIVVMARVIDNKIIIEEDTSLDKPLVDALMMNAHIPREQIVLRYAGESIPNEGKE